MSRGGTPPAGGNSYNNYTSAGIDTMDDWDEGPASAAPAASADLFAPGDESSTPWDMPMSNAVPTAAAAAPAGAWDVQISDDTVPAVDGTRDVRIEFTDSTAAPDSPLRAATEAAPSQDQPRRAREAADPGKTAFYQLAHYRTFFDVDTKVEAQPDLYGPFWLSTAAIFLMAMVANALSWQAHSDDSSPWSYDVKKVVYAASIFYGYVFAGGGALWAWLYLLNNAQVALTALWCIYGYSMAIWIPVTVVAIVPNDMFQWLLAMGASLYSGVFLVVNLKQAISESLATKTKQFFTILAVFAAHLVTGLLLRLFVFTYSVNDASAAPALQSSPPVPPSDLSMPVERLG